MTDAEAQAVYILESAIDSALDAASLKLSTDEAPTSPLSSPSSLPDATGFPLPSDEAEDQDVVVISKLSVVTILFSLHEVDTRLALVT